MTLKILIALLLIWIALLIFTPTPAQPCGGDADCHAKNPGLCAQDEPYCF